VATGYAGIAGITSSDNQAVLPANAGLTNGIGTFSVTLETAGTQSITATDIVTSPITGSQTGIAVKGFAQINGNSVVAYIPVALTNSQSSATPTNFQQMITVDSNNFNSYLTSNVDNVNWQDGNGHILNSWLESGNSNTATSTVYWVNLGSNIIAANGGALTIYYCIYAPSVNALNLSNTGEFPTATGTYGQYDNGANVFTYYDNFAGTTIGSQYTQVTPSPGSITQNNGITVTTGSGNNYGGLILNTVYSTSSPLFWEGDVTSVSGVASGLMAESGSASSSMGYGLNYWSGSVAYGSMSGGFTQSDIPNLQIGTGIMGVSWAGSSSQYYNKNYFFTSGTSSYLTLPSSEYYSIGMYWDSPSSSVSFQWVRLRLLPPSNVMPTVSLGNLGA
jgi:hypothetical protein